MLGDITVTNGVGVPSQSQPLPRAPTRVTATAPPTFVRARRRRAALPEGSSCPPVDASVMSVPDHSQTGQVFDERFTIAVKSGAVGMASEFGRVRKVPDSSSAWRTSPDRRGGVQGKGGYVRVDFGGGSFCKKNTAKTCCRIDY